MLCTDYISSLHIPATASAYYGSTNLGNFSSTFYSSYSVPLHYGVGNMAIYTNSYQRVIYEAKISNASFGNESSYADHLSFVCSYSTSGLPENFNMSAAIGISGFYVHTDVNAVNVPIGTLINWVGTVVNALGSSGLWFTLLPVFCIFVAVPVILVTIKIVRKVSWGT